MLNRILAFILFFLLPLAASQVLAEIVISIHDEPLVAKHRAAVKLAPGSAATGQQGVRSLFAEGNTPSASVWLTPQFRVDTTSFGTTSLWSARNESGVQIDILASYFDVFNIPQTSQLFGLDPQEIVPVNVRDVAGLPVDPDGFARGFVQIESEGPISVDFFQVDTTENFASGTVGVTFADFCTEWQGRLLSFGPGEGSTFSFLVNGPLGPDPGDSPTVLGEVYDQTGAFINSFTIRTDEWVFDIDVLDFVVGPTAFGSVELFLDTELGSGGFVAVGHSAEGRFSVGLPAVCKDLLLRTSAVSPTRRRRGSARERSGPW